VSRETDQPADASPRALPILPIHWLSRRQVIVKLTPHQRNRLHTYWKFHRKPPTGADQMKRIAPQLGMFGLLCAIAAAGAFVDDPLMSRLALVMLGLFVGMATSAVAYVRMTLHQWPLVEHITDWNLVEELHNENAPDAG
jgi:hypothetical protein